MEKNNRYLNSQIHRKNLHNILRFQLIRIKTFLIFFDIFGFLKKFIILYYMKFN